MKAWGVFKLAWGVAITLVTVVIGYAQYRAMSHTVRPSVLVDVAPPSPSLRAERGAFSHTIQLRNVGTVAAEEVTVDVQTKHAGRMIHEDRDHGLGILMPGEHWGYAVFVHAEDIASLDLTSDRPLLEVFRVSYRTGNLIKFWCDTVYTYEITFVFRPAEARWRPHPMTKPAETDACL